MIGLILGETKLAKLILRKLTNMPEVCINENNNGTFINLTEQGEHIIQVLEKYTIYVKEQQEQLNKIEVGHKHLNELIVVSSMHLRKAKMAEMSEAIISLPGGVGTWEEFFEALAWNQLGLYSKPIILLDIDDYYSDLYKFAEKGVQEGFLPNSTFEDLVLCNSVQSALKVVKSFQPKDGKDWFKRLERDKWLTSKRLVKEFTLN